MKKKVCKFKKNTFHTIGLSASIQQEAVEGNTLIRFKKGLDWQLYIFFN